MILPPTQLMTGLIVSTQAEWDEAMRVLAKSPAAVRMVTIAPLRGPIRLGIMPEIDPAWRGRWTRSNDVQARLAYDRAAMLALVTVGANAADQPVRWLRSIFHECRNAGVPLCILPPLDAAWCPDAGWPDELAQCRGLVKLPPMRAVRSEGVKLNEKVPTDAHG